MHTEALIETARALVANDKGLLAMDESNGTCHQRFASAGIPQTLEMRRAYRELLLTAPGLGECISGVILCDETIRQAKADGTSFVDVARDAGLRVGIKVDTGAKELVAYPGEKVTERLDGLRERLQAYFAMGARFAKWRGVIVVGDARLPTTAGIAVNAHALARCAALCQEAGLVPIVEPEVLMDGTHTQQRCPQVTEAVLCNAFGQLPMQSVVLEAMVLKPNMVLAGLACATQNTAAEVANAMVQCLLRVVPAAVPGIAFLSGGQSGRQATGHLNAMHIRNDRPSTLGTDSHPRALSWPLSFSFARALQLPALGIWAGNDANRLAAQQALLHRSRCNCAALKREYSTTMEST